MAKPGKRDIARAILTRYPKSQAEMLGINLARNTPAPLFQWLLVCLLFSAPISGKQSEKAAGALFEAGWRTPRKMAATRWEERVKILNHAGYARYDESTARYIGETTETLLRDYDGDLRKLRAEAGGDPAQLRDRLKQFKGVGDVAVDIFFREVQGLWDELAPFADERARQVAVKLGLGEDAAALQRLVGQSDLPRLLAGLVRMDLDGETDTVLGDAA